MAFIGIYWHLLAFIIQIIHDKNADCSDNCKIHKVFMAGFIYLESWIPNEIENAQNNTNFTMAGIFINAKINMMQI